MQSQQTKFVYSPLSNASTDIRLVSLEPGAEEDEIRCRIIHGNQNSIEHYEALSYAWGDPTATLPILLDDKLFEVTRNLESALRNLRDSSKDKSQARILWIDAICINQKNSNELNVQVQRMRSIYQSATHVLIWLGNYYEPQDDSIKFNRDIWGFEQLDGDLSKLTQGAFEAVERVCWNSSITPSMYWGQLLRLVHRTWFTRLWVVQEVKVAKKALVVCGQSTIPWAKLVDAARSIAIMLTFSVRDHADSHKFLSVLTLGGPLKSSLEGADFTNILSVLHRTNSFKASNPKDRLYGIIGITNEEEIQDVEINYSEEVNVVSVYIDWTLKRIQRTGTLDVFSACQDSRKLAPTKGNIYPSWVPDLEREWASDENLFSLTHGTPRSASNRPYKAAGLSSSNIRISQDRLEISLTGVCLDSIEVLGSVGAGFTKQKLVFDVDDRMPDIIATIESWENLCFEFFQTTFTYETPFYQIFLDVLFRGYEYFHFDTTNISLQTRYSDWRRHAAQQPGVKHNSTQGSWRGPSCYSMELVILHMVNHCQFFITKKGYLGMVGGGCNAKVGDHVYVLHGGATPFLLRQQENEENSQRNCYNLMGPCYLGGFMYGEALENDELHEEEITLV